MPLTTIAPRPSCPDLSTQATRARLCRFLDRARLPTPCLVVDLDRIAASYAAFRRALPAAQVYYAIKANPAPAVVRRLIALGARCDVASPAEVRLALAAGATPDRIGYGNTIKKEADIADAFALGVRLFAVDSIAEVDKVARAAPGARVTCRLMVDNVGAEWPLARKFGCDATTAVQVLERAVARGLAAAGLSFHVGSQQTDPSQWDAGIAASRAVFAALATRGIRLRLLNLGGGFPACYRRAIAPVAVYGEQIRASLLRHFGGEQPELLIEPGRGLVGDAGVIETEVVLITEKPDPSGAPVRWVFLDVGKFGGLAETMDEAIQYPIESTRRGPPRRVVLAGPTCDSVDVLYERAAYELPEDLRIGDRLRIFTAGAYTGSYASVGFNGFAPLAIRCLGGRSGVLHARADARTSGPDAVVTAAAR